jgi:hypothetical protein
LMVGLWDLISLVSVVVREKGTLGIFSSTTTHTQRQVCIQAKPTKRNTK